MGNDIETGRRERNTQLTYLEEHRKQKQTILYTVLNGLICRFLYIKKILYTNLYMANIVYYYSFLIRSPIKKCY